MSRWTWWRNTDRPRTRQCPVDAAMLQSYLDGELDAGDAARVRSHVAECHACARELSLYQRISRALAARAEAGTDAATLGRLREFADSLAERETQDPDPARGAEHDAGQSAGHKAGG